MIAMKMLVAIAAAGCAAYVVSFMWTTLRAHWAFLKFIDRWR